MALRISGALSVNTDEVFGILISKKLLASGDYTLLESALGWLIEEADRQKLHLSHSELAHWASYVYREASKRPLNFQATKYLTFTIINVIKKERQKHG